MPRLSFGLSTFNRSLLFFVLGVFATGISTASNTHLAMRTADDIIATHLKEALSLDKDNLPGIYQNYRSELNTTIGWLFSKGLMVRDCEGKYLSLTDKKPSVHSLRIEKAIEFSLKPLLIPLERDSLETHAKRFANDADPHVCKILERYQAVEAYVKYEGIAKPASFYPVVKEGDKLRAILPEVSKQFINSMLSYSSFIALALKQNEAQLTQVAEDQQKLYQEVKQTIDSSLEMAAEWLLYQKTLDYLLRSNADWLVNEIGVTRSKLQTMLDRTYQQASNIDKEKKSKLEDIKKRMSLKERVETVRSTIKSAEEFNQKVAEALGTARLIEPDKLVKDSAKKSVEEIFAGADFGIVFIPTGRTHVVYMNGKQQSGYAIYDVVAFFRTTASKVQILPGKYCKGESDYKETCEQFAKFKSAEGRYELYRQTGWIKTSPDGKFTHLSSGITSTGSVSKGINDFFYAMGVPNYIETEVIDASLSESMDLELRLKLPGGHSHYSLVVIEAGKGRSKKDIVNDLIAYHVENYIKPQYEQWVNTYLTFIKAKAEDLSLPYGFLLGDTAVSPNYDANNGKFSIAVPIRPYGLGVATDAIITLVYDQTGFGVSKIEVPNEVEQALSNKGRALLGKSIPDKYRVYITDLNVLLLGQALDAQLYLSVPNDTCQLSVPLRLAYPFIGLEERLGIAVGGLVNRVKQCANEVASNYAQDKLKGFVVGRPVNVLGIEWSIKTVNKIGGGQFNLDVSATFSANGQAFEIVVKDLLGTVSADKPPSVKVTDKTKLEPKKSQALVKFLDASLKSYLPAGIRWIEVKDPRINVKGLSASVILHDIQFVGTLNVGRVYLSASNESIEKTLRNVVYGKLAEAFNDYASNHLSLEGLGALKSFTPRASVAGQAIKFVGDAVFTVYDDMTATATIELFPTFKVNMPDISENATALLGQLAGEAIPLKVPPVEFVGGAFTNRGGEYRYEYTFSLKIDAGIVAFEGSDMGIGIKGIRRPDTFSASIDYPLEFGYVAIAKPGLRYYLREKKFSVLGEVTVLNAEMAKIVNISSAITTNESLSRFELDGALVLVTVLPILNAEGVFDLSGPTVNYKTYTNPSFKKLFEAKGHGEFDGPKKIIHNETSVSLLGVKLSESYLDISFDENVIDYWGYENLLVGEAWIGIKTERGLQKPRAETKFKLKLFGWSPLSAGLIFDLKKAELKTKALGIEIDVVTPQVWAITPELLLDILENLLKIDLKSLFNSDLTKIKISLLDGDGNLNDPNGGDDNPGSSDSGEGSRSGEGGVSTPAEASKSAPDRNQKGDPKANNSWGNGDFVVPTWCTKIEKGRWAIIESQKQPRIVKERPRDNCRVIIGRGWGGCTIELITVGDKPSKYQDHYYGDFYQKKDVFNDEVVNDLCIGGKIESPWLTVHSFQHSTLSSLSRDKADCGQSGIVQSELITIGGNGKPTHVDQAFYCGSLKPGQDYEDYETDYIELTELTELTEKEVEQYKYERPDDEYYDKAYKLVVEKNAELAKYKPNITYSDYKISDEGCRIWEVLKPCTYHLKIKLLLQTEVDYYDWYQGFRLYYLSETHNKKSPGFYAVSTCLPQSDADGYEKTQSYKRRCRPKLIKLDTPPGIVNLPDMVASRRISVSGFERFRLLQQAAASLDGKKYSLNSSAPYTISDGAKSYRVVELYADNGNETTYYIEEVGTQENGAKETIKIFTLTYKNSLYPWFKLLEFRDGLILHYLDAEKGKKIYYADLTDKKLVLEKTSKSATERDTYWFYADELKPIKVVLPNIIPMMARSVDAQGKLPQGKATDKDKKNIVTQFYDKVKAHGWSKIGFGKSVNDEGIDKWWLLIGISREDLYFHTRPILLDASPRDRYFSESHPFTGQKKIGRRILKRCFKNERVKLLYGDLESKAELVRLLYPDSDQGESNETGFVFPYNLIYLPGLNCEGRKL